MQEWGTPLSLGKGLKPGRKDGRMDGWMGKAFLVAQGVAAGKAAVFTLTQGGFICFC